MPISLSGSLNLSGSLTTTGTITATTLVVQTITSSISSITGSTNFGSLVTDTHKFTGSLNVTGAFYVTTGSVGIGTVSPSQLLEVVGGEIKAGRVDSSNEGGQLSFGRSTDNATAWYIDAYGNTASPQLRFVNVSNAVVAMTITGSNVGIGTSSPSALLHLVQSTSNLNIYLQNTLGSGRTWAVNSDTNGKFNIHDTTANRLTITSEGNVGIGTNSPTNFGATNTGLSINGAGGNAGLLDLQYNGTSGMVVYSDISGTTNYESRNLYMRFGTNNTERMRITSGGFLKVSNSGAYYSSTDNYFEFKSNVSDNTMIMWNSSALPAGLFINYTASPNNTSNHFLRCFDGNVGTERASIRSNGGLANYSGNNVNLASDRRLKKDIIPLSSEWNNLKQIEVVNFKYKDSNEETTLYGAIAQQVQEVYPNLVIVTREATETEPEYYGLREQPFQWLTTKVLQEAMAKIETLEARVQYLENK